MRRYTVQKCDEDGKDTGAPLEIYAASEIKAAEIATGMKLRQRGKSEEMRARVYRTGHARRRLSRSLHYRLLEARPDRASHRQRRAASAGQPPIRPRVACEPEIP